MQKNNKTDIVWTLFKTQHYHYGKSGKLMSIVSVNEKTQKKTQSIFTRDKNGRKLAESIFAIDDAERQLEKIEKKIYKYNDDKAQATETIYRWDRKANDFMPYVKTILEREGKLHSTRIEQKWDSEIEEWTTSLVSEFNKKYHDKGRLCAIKITDSKNDGKKQERQVLQTFNLKHQLSSEREFFPYLDMFEIDCEGNFDSIIGEDTYYGSITCPETLIEINRKTYQYDKQQRLITYIENEKDRRRWRFMTPLIKIEYEYDDNDLLAKRKIFGGDV